MVLFSFFIAQKLKSSNVGARIIKFDIHTIYGNVTRYIEEKIEKSHFKGENVVFSARFV